MDHEVSVRNFKPQFAREQNTSFPHSSVQYLDMTEKLLTGMLNHKTRQKKIFEPCHEKNRFLPMRKQWCRNCTADQRLCFCYMDSTVPLFLKSKISSFYPAFVTVQAGLCQTLSETQIVGFLASRLIWQFMSRFTPAQGDTREDKGD